MIQTRPCLCGCGAAVPVVDRRGRPRQGYVSGHNAKPGATSGYRRLLEGQREEAHCPTCRNAFTRDAGRGRKQRYCSAKCANTGKRGLARPATALGRFLLGDWEASGAVSYAKYAETIGVSGSTLARLLSGHAPTTGTLGRLLAHFGEVLPPVETREDRLREAGLTTTQFDKVRPRGHEPKSRRKVAEKLRGRTRPPEVREKIRATKQARGQIDRQRAQLRRITATREHRLRAMLLGRLRHRPEPSRPEIRGWAGQVAATIDSRPGAVLTAWGPILKARGLSSAAGRRANEKRHRLVADLVRRMRPDGGRLPPGFWNEAATAVSGDISGPDLYNWYRQHVRNCSGDV